MLGKALQQSSLVQYGRMMQHGRMVDLNSTLQCIAVKHCLVHRRARRLAGPQSGLGRLAPVTVLIRATLIFEAVLVESALLSMRSSQ